MYDTGCIIEGILGCRIQAYDTGCIIQGVLYRVYNTGCIIQGVGYIEPDAEYLYLQPFPGKRFVVPKIAPIIYYR